MTLERGHDYNKVPVPDRVSGIRPKILSAGDTKKIVDWANDRLFGVVRMRIIAERNLNEQKTIANFKIQ